MATSDPRTKVIGLLDALRTLDADYQAKRDALLAEMSLVLNGGEGIGPKLARLKKTFSDAWQVRYGTPYTFTQARDTAHLKRFLAAGHSETEIAARMFTYLKSSEPFYTKARHSFPVFVQGFNNFVGVARPVDDGAADVTDRLLELRGE